MFFKKSSFGGSDGGYGTIATDPAVLQQPETYFPITVAVKKTTP
jgi:hypothetical protein